MKRQVDGRHSGADFVIIFHVGRAGTLGADWGRLDGVDRISSARPRESGDVVLWPKNWMP